MDIKCIECGRHPWEIHEYQVLAEDYEEEPKDWPRIMDCEDGSYNANNGHFWCTECYVNIGMPLGVAP
jgi:hypothetical protein